MRSNAMHIVKTKTLFDSKEFETKYHTDAPLGAFCGQDGTLFRLWAPTADRKSVV